MIFFIKLTLIQFKYGIIWALFYFEDSQIKIRWDHKFWPNTFLNCLDDNLIK